VRKITQDARALLSSFYEDQPTIARAIREGVLDRKHERALKALSFVIEQRINQSLPERVSAPYGDGDGDDERKRTAFG
jgi:hypothetical protein